MSCAPQEHYSNLVINDPGSLRVIIEDNFVTVYRSVLIKDDSLIYQQVLNIVGDRRPVKPVDVVADPNMYHRKAEWILYDLRA